MPGIGVQVSGDDELQRALKQAGHKLTQALGNAVFEVALLMETDAKRAVTDNGTTDTARLVSGIGVDKIDNVTADVRSNAAYSGAVELGAAPHWVPIGPLLDWARRKLGDEGAAYAVQKKIAEQGTPAQPFMTPARETAAGRLRETMVKHARRITGS